MRKYILLFLLASLLLHSQNIGINTTLPTKSLDVNGNLRVRGNLQRASNAAKDSIMVFENDGIVKYTSASKIIQQIPTGYFPMVKNSTLKGTGTTANQLGIYQMSANTNQALGWTGSYWQPVDQLSSSNWLFVGNSNTTNVNILGNVNDAIMDIRSNNTSMLQVGTRQTLNLYDSSNTGLYPYNQPNNSVSYIRGTGGNSSLQFESSSSLSYKPVFFTDSDGNFGFRGSAAGNDWFEVASKGSSNNGSLQFTIGDDGNEPIIFRKFNATTKTYVEMMRMQGTGLSNIVRTGINLNGNTPNSTFQVNGSISKSISTKSTSTTLTELDYVVLINNSSTITITLPSAATCIGRIYILKRQTSQIVNISDYLNRLSATSSSLPNGVTQIQSDGANWQQIN